MLSPKLPQREMLRRLLDSGKLTPSEAEAAGKLRDDIVDGRIGGLNHAQSVWAEQLCKKYGIVASRPALNIKKATKEDKERVIAQFDAMPRPKKPPGKR
jgi:hypothetical protein